MEEQIDLTDPRIAKAFNEWMRRFTEHPERFGQEWQVVAQFLREQGSGVQPSYGAVCAEYLRRMVSEV